MDAENRFSQSVDLIQGIMGISKDPLLVIPSRNNKGTQETCQNQLS